MKTEYDPCPEGWRVPSYAELNELISNKSSWTSEDGQNGYWFSGLATYTTDTPQVFFPAAGSRSLSGFAPIEATTAAIGRPDRATTAPTTSTSTAAAPIWTTSTMRTGTLSVASRQPKKSLSFSEE